MIPENNGRSLLALVEMAKLRLCVDKRRQPLHDSSDTQVATDQEGSSGGGLRQPANSVRGEESHSRQSSCCAERHEFDHLGRLVVSRQAFGARGTGGRTADTTKQSGEHLTVSTVAGCCTRPIRRARLSSFKLQPGCRWHHARSSNELHGVKVNYRPYYPTSCTESILGLYPTSCTESITNQQKKNLPHQGKAAGQEIQWPNI